MVRSPLAALLAILAASPVLAQCESAHLLASDPQLLDVMGWGADMQGDLIALGAIGDDDACTSPADCNSGAVYIFREVAGVWTQEAKLTPASSGNNFQFGHDVAVSGNRLLLGEHVNDAGLAYIYDFDGSSWVQQAVLSGSDAQTAWHFGHSVALQGDIAVVGAMRDTHAGTEAGSVYIFVFDGSTWVELQKITASDAGPGARFGRSSDIDGDVIVVGAHLHDLSGPDQGSAYVYERDDNGTPADLLDDVWSEVAHLVPSGAGNGEFFGRSVGVSGDTIVVGAEFADPGGVATGAAYVFERQGGVWVETQELTASNGVLGDGFGISCSVDGDDIIVGAYQSDHAGLDSGATYLFRRTPLGFVESGLLLSSQAAAGDGTGDETGVCVDAGRALITSRFATASATGDGAGYVFDLSGCLGDTFCSTSPNSQGPGALISASGSTSISADSFFLETAGGVPNQFGVFFYSPTQAFVPFGDGALCVGPPSAGVFRLQPVVQMSAAGDAVHQVDYDGHPAGTPGGSEITPGSVFNFQFWYRDPQGPGGSGFNLSDGVEVAFLP